MGLNCVITGSTGMIGKGVLLECLDHPQIEKVLVINRRSLHMNHPKLKEIINGNFQDFESIKDELSDCDACFHCMGVSAVGMNEEKYTELTYGISTKLADILYQINPNSTFIYVSGTGTKSSEKGSMWARVKGKTENYILNKGFKSAVMFRPGFIIPERGIRSSTGWYNTIYAVLRPFFPLLRKSNGATTTTKIGQAMIRVALNGSEFTHPENKEINQLAAG